MAVIISLLVLLGSITVGYAAFQTNFNIKGNAQITSNWDIRITNVTESNKTGSGISTTPPTWTHLTASMEADLYEKGDSVEYDITIENKGTLDAKLENIISNVKSDNEAIKISFSGYAKGEKLFKNETKIIKTKIEYNPNFNGKAEGSSTVEVVFGYSQAEGGTITPSGDTYLLTYDYKTNGGTDTSVYDEYLEENAEINLNYAPIKLGYEFIGWNTDKDATIGLKSYQMPNQATTLYAIYRKTLTVNYEKSSAVESINRNSDTCYLYNNDQTCEITLPEIVPNAGYTSVGWSITNEFSSGIAAGSKVSVNANATYYANALDKTGPSTPTITNSSGGDWSSNDVVVTVTSTDEGSGIDHYEWYENDAWVVRALTTTNGKGTITYAAERNETIQFRAVDKAGNVSDVSTTTVKIDKSSPTLSVSTSKTTNSITVVASASAFSEIAKYEYSKDGGTTWVTGNNNTYTFEKLKNGTTYSIRVRVTSGSLKQTTSTATSVITDDIAVPTFKESGTTTKTVTITYPTGCGSTYTCTYKKDNGTAVNVTSTTATVNFTASGSVVATVSDGQNTVSSSYTVSFDIAATYHAAYYSCSTGTLDGTRCRITTQSSTDTKTPTTGQCSSGYVNINGVCHRDLDVPNMRGCYGLADTEWDDTLGVCYDIYDIDSSGGLTCPSGYVYNSSTKKCHKTVTSYQNATYHAAYYSCPSGYTLSGTRCYK